MAKVKRTFIVDDNYIVYVKRDFLTSVNTITNFDTLLLVTFFE